MSSLMLSLLSYWNTRTFARKQQEKSEEQWSADTLFGISKGKNEQAVARYLDFADIGDYRAYQCSHGVMNVFLEWLSVEGNGQVRSKILFKILADEDNREEAFAGTLEELAQKIPIPSETTEINMKTKVNRNKRLAALLFKLVHSDDAWVEEEQVAVNRRLREMDETKVLATIESAPAQPAWGPLEDELWGEPYNRAWNLISFLTNSWTRWKDDRLTGGDDGKLKRREIPISEAPKLMLRYEKESGESSKTFLIYWADPKDVRQTLEEEYDELPSLEQVAYEPRGITREEWRDKFRTQYQFQAPRRNSASITLEWAENGARTKEFLKLHKEAYKLALESSTEREKSCAVVQSLEQTEDHLRGD